MPAFMVRLCDVLYHMAFTDVGDDLLKGGSRDPLL